MCFGWQYFCVCIVKFITVCFGYYFCCSCCLYGEMGVVIGTFVVLRYSKTLKPTKEKTKTKTETKIDFNETLLLKTGGFM